MHALATPPAVPLIPVPEAPMLQVLLVCPRGEYLQRLRWLASRWPQAAQVNWIPDPQGAVRHVQASAPQLAIVDARIERAGASSLSARLRSLSPQMMVMNFDTPGGMHGQAHGSHWHWCELDKATDWWIRRHFGMQALQSAPTAQ